MTCDTVCYPSKISTVLISLPFVSIPLLSLNRFEGKKNALKQTFKSAPCSCCYIFLSYYNFKLTFISWLRSPFGTKTCQRVVNDTKSMSLYSISSLYPHDCFAFSYPEKNSVSSNSFYTQTSRRLNVRQIYETPLAY